jgi:hypothetical protein
MKRRLYAGLVLALVTTAAYADQFAGYYGNTVSIKHPGGATSTVFVNVDKTWEHRTPDGKTYRGTYAWKDDTHVCLTLVDPPPAPGEDAQECHEVTGDHKLGDTWTDSDGKGHTTTFTITAGR